MTMPTAALAYVFWHAPAPRVDVDEYEAVLVRWHAALSRDVMASASWRLPDGVPWLPDWTRPAYEDWYLVTDWSALGRLEHDAVSSRLVEVHDTAARDAARGVAGVWRGPPRLPGDQLGWTDEAPDEDAIAWRRCLTLGPAPQYAVDGSPGPPRERVR